MAVGLTGGTFVSEESHRSRIEVMAAFGLTLVVMAVVLLLAEAHLSTGGLIGACASVAAIAGWRCCCRRRRRRGDRADRRAVRGGGVHVVAAALRRRILSPLRVRPRTGREALVGHVGVVRSGDSTEAQVFIDGSLWRAEPSPVHYGAECTTATASSSNVSTV